MSKKEEMSTITLRLPERIIEEVKARAAKEDRTVSNMFRVILSELIER